MARIVWVSLALLSLSPAQAAWYLVQDNQVVGHEAKAISNDEFEFTLDGMKCGVSKPFQSNLGGKSFESRDLFCWASKDTYVSVRNSCEGSETHKAQALQIKKSEKTYWPSLICQK